MAKLIRDRRIYAKVRGKVNNKNMTTVALMRRQEKELEWCCQKTLIKNDCVTETAQWERFRNKVREERIFTRVED